MCTPIHAVGSLLYASQRTCDYSTLGLSQIRVAQQYLQRANNGNAEAAERVANEFLLKNSFKRAIKYFSIAYKHGPLNPRFGTYKLGMARYCAGDQGGALAVFRANYFMAPRDPMVRSFLKARYHTTFSEAQNELTDYRYGPYMPGQFPSMETDFVQGLRSAGAGRLDSAQKSLTKCVVRSANFGAAHLLLGMVAYARNERRLARTQWILAVESWEPQPPDTAGVTFYQSAAMIFLTKMPQ